MNHLTSFHQLGLSEAESGVVDGVLKQVECDFKIMTYLCRFDRS